MAPKVAVSIALALLASACAQLPNAGDGADSPSAATASNANAGANPVTPTPPVQLATGPTPQLIVPAEAEAAEKPAATEPVPARTLWDRVRKHFALPPMDNPLVHEWENWYASRPEYVARMVERSSRFLYHVVEEVERRGMPSEIALLPMIESAYNPVAYSHSHASGIWQFIPSTGKLYGLRQNWWYDGRRDIIAATNAALDYLQKLHDQFGDWDLALASYNWGEGAVSRAIERNRARGLPTDYESLSMPEETRRYVPKLIAVKNIITDPGRFGLQLADIPNKPYFATVPVKHHIDVKMAAKLAEITLEEFKFLNPAHNKRVIKKGAGETIVLPKDKVEVFLANLKSTDEPLVSWQAHTVRPGERPEKIAKHYGMTLHELKEINGIPPRKRIVTGEPLLVPVLDAQAEPNLPDLPARPVPLPRAVHAAHVSPHRHAQLRHVKVARHGAKPAKVASRPTQRVKVVLKKRVQAIKRKVVHAKAAQPHGSSNVIVAENRKDSDR